MSALENLPDAPYANRLVDPDGQMAGPWREWYWLALIQRLQQAPQAKPVVHLAGQHASIGTTALVASASAGIYRVSWRLRVTTADGAASSIAVTILSVDGGVNCSEAGAALTADNVTLPKSGSILVRADASSPISFSTTYASTTPNAMQYALSIVVEAIG